MYKWWVKNELKYMAHLVSTWKTTYLIDLVNQEMKRGVRPNEIIFSRGVEFNEDTLVDS